MKRQPKYAPKSEPGERRRCNLCGQMALVPDEIKPLGRRCFACQEQVKDDYWQSYYAANREKQLAYQAAYREAHREEINAYQRDYAAAHREECRRNARAWYLANREDAIAKRRAYTLAHPELQREWQRNHYARQLKTKAGRLEYLESSRMRARLNAERKGQKLTPVSLDEYRERYGSENHHVRVPTAPLLQHLLDALAREDRTALADRAGVAPRRIWEIVDDEQPECSLAVADALCAAIEMPFSWLYQDVA